MKEAMAKRILATLRHYICIIIIVCVCLCGCASVCVGVRAYVRV